MKNFAWLTQLRSRHPDRIILVRAGDFYECFGGDALIVSEALRSKATIMEDKEGNCRALFGFPSDELESVLKILLKAGRRVAVCEEVSR